MVGRLISRLTDGLAELCGWLLLIVMGLIVVDLVSRATGSPVYGVSESAMFVMIAIVYMGLPYAEKLQTHVRVELVVDALPPRIAAVIDLVTYLIVTGTMLVVLYAVVLNAAGAYASRQAIAGPTPLLIWPVKFVMVFALGLYVLRIIINLWRAVRRVIVPSPTAPEES